MQDVTDYSVRAVIQKPKPHRVFKRGRLMRESISLDNIMNNLSNDGKTLMF